MVPLRTVTFVWPPTRTPTLSSCGFGQVCGPMPGPLMVCPFRSRTTLSTWITNASPGHDRSFATTMSPVTCVLHFTSRGGMVSVGALVALGSGTGDGVVIVAAFDDGDVGVAGALPVGW